MARKMPDLKILGSVSKVPADPSVDILERFENPHPDSTYVVRFTAPEFTCLCPMTGQPDFAHFVIDYVPGGWLVESKSLKLHLASYRNEGGFHEQTTIDIGKRLVNLLSPRFIRMGGYWYARGGMPIDVFWQHGKCPANLWLPDQGVATYRGRG